MSLFNLTKEEEERALRVHREALVVDAHCDTILSLMSDPIPPRKMRKFGERSTEGNVDLPRLREGGVKCQFFAVYVEPVYHQTPTAQALRMLDAFYSALNQHSKDMFLATNFEEIMQSLKENRISAILSIEGGEPLVGQLSILRILHKLGVRAMTLTHSPRNMLANGVGEKHAKGGLTDFGVQVVEEMNRLGMVVDVSHMGEKGFWDTMQVCKDPVIASHSNCKSICDVPRNLSDEQIKAIAEKDGVIGVTYVRSFLDKNEEGVTVFRVLDHIDYMVKIAGINHVGLGSDFDGLGPKAPVGLEDASKTPNITRGLVQRGYSDEEIKKILGENFLRVLGKTLKLK